MSVVVEPVHVGPTVVKGMNELVRDHPGHMGLLVDVVLTQNDLRTNANFINIKQSNSITAGAFFSGGGQHVGITPEYLHK